LRFLREIAGRSEHGGETKAPAGDQTQQAVKTIACGTPDVSGATVVTTLVCQNSHFAREAADALCIRRSARPHDRGRDVYPKPGRESASRDRGLAAIVMLRRSAHENQ
jgi:hypothetical protein